MGLVLAGILAFAGYVAVVFWGISIGAIPDAGAITLITTVGQGIGYLFMMGIANLIHGGPEEAFQLLWEAARRREAWAIQEVCRRFAPEIQSLRLLQEADDDEIDYTKFSDEEIDKLHAILQRGAAQPLKTPGGKSKT